MVKAAVDKKAAAKPSKWTVCDSEPDAVWFTTNFRWRGFTRTFRRVVGGLIETKKILFPEKQTRVGRSKYIPAGKDRNVPATGPAKKPC